MWDQERIFGLSSTNVVVLLATLVKFSLYIAPGYGFFGDEFYTLALMALSRALLGESFFAFRIFPALAGSATLVFVCLITREFGEKHSL